MLSPSEIKDARPRATSYRLTDTGGLYLLVTPTGERLWRMQYRFNEKERVFPLGTYPHVSLRTARKLREMLEHRLYFMAFELIREGAIRVATHNGRRWVADPTPLYRGSPNDVCFYCSLGCAHSERAHSLELDELAKTRAAAALGLRGILK